MRSIIVIVALSVFGVQSHLTCDPTKEDVCKPHVHDHDHGDFKGGFHDFDFKTLDPADESCESLSKQHGVMYNDNSCSSNTCQAVNNPSCDDVNFEQPKNDMDTYCDDPEKTLFDALADEIRNPRSDCTASTEGICSDLQGFFSAFDSSIVAAYCTEKYLVVWSHGHYKEGTTQCDTYLQHLTDVPRPPGIPYKKDDHGYDDQCVGRSSTAQLQVYKFPLTPAEYMENPELWGEDFFPTSTVGMVLSGLPHYPAIDNTFLTVWDACESSMCNAHVGMGNDLHYHGNPMGTECHYQNGSSPWYDHTGDPHALPIGISSDGYMMYGQYQSHTDNHVALDDCGGHNHTVSNSYDTQEYHYHAYTSESDDLYYFWQGPSSCWRGDVSKLDNFYSQGYTVNYDSSRDCGITRRNDYQDLQLCRDSDQSMYYPGEDVKPCNWFD